MLFKLNGLVLKQRNIGEHDRILVLLTKEKGVVEVCARGVKRMRSPLAGGCMPLCYSEFCLFEGRKYITVDAATPIRNFYHLRLDPEKLALGEYFCDLASVLTPESESAWPMLRLLLNTLALLEDDRRQPLLLKAIFELRSAAIAGFMPDLVACSGCGAFEEKQMYFFPQDSCLLCGNCKAAHAREGQGGVLLRPAVLKAMRQILYADEEKLFSFSLKGDSLKQLDRITERYLWIHTGLQSRALSVYRALQAP